MHRDSKHVPVARKQLDDVSPVRGVRLYVADKKAGSLKVRLSTVCVGSLARVALFTALSPFSLIDGALASRRARPRPRGGRLLSVRRGGVFFTAFPVLTAFSTRRRSTPSTSINLLRTHFEGKRDVTSFKNKERDKVPEKLKQNGRDSTNTKMHVYKIT